VYTQIASTRLRLQPSILLGGLDAIAQTIARDAERSEVAITRMGDLLRGLLHSSDQDQLSIDDEVALLRAYLDVRSAASIAGKPEITVDSPWLPLTDCTVPALSMVSFAGIIDGELGAVCITHHEASVAMTVRTTPGLMDQDRFAQLDSRLRDLGDEYRMSARNESGSLVLELEMAVHGTRRRIDHASQLISA
jgi:hypothetical protein